MPCHCECCPCCSRVPSCLNLSLPSQPSSDAASSWKPPKNAHSARSYLNISHRLCCPMQARLLGQCSPNTRVGCPAQRWLYITTMESGPSSSLATLSWASPATFVVPQFPHWKEGEAVTPGVCVAAHRYAVAPFQASPPSPSLG